MIKSRKTIKNLILYIFLITVGIFTAGPFLWLLSTSLMKDQNIFTFPPKIIPYPITFDNFIGVWKFLNIPKYIINTIIITGSTVAANVFLSCLTAYPLAVYRFKYKNVIFYAIVATMIIPAAAGMIINYLTINKLGLLNTYLGVILPSCISTFNIFLMRQAFLTVPLEIKDAAKIDGAGEFRIWWQVMLPTVRPTIAVIALFQFMSSWNDFLWPIIVLNDPEKYPLAAALTYLNGQFSYNFRWIASGTVLSVFPIIVLFIFFQKYFIEGMAGAVKG